MANRPLRPCLHPGCPALSTGPRCPAHTVAYKHAYEHDRGSPASRGYDRRWQKLRAAHLARQPACVACGSTDRLEVHHIVPVAEGGGMLDARNLETRCLRCHSRVTAERRGSNFSESIWPK